jgi:hypothetical protein
VGNATLAVARLKAVTQPRLGTIFTNPGQYIVEWRERYGMNVYYAIGGPGGSGVDFLIQGAGNVISNVTLGHYDIVSK